MNNYILLLSAVVFNAVANILIKVGMMRCPKSENLYLMAKSALFHPAIIGGIICFVIALGGYSYTLSKLNLSIAYPIMTSLGYLIVVVVSCLLLHETITWYQLIGFFLIIGGVWMVAR